MTQTVTPLMTPTIRVLDIDGTKTGKASSSPRLPPPTQSRSFPGHGNHPCSTLGSVPQCSQPLALILTPCDTEGLIQAWVLHLAGISLLFPRNHSQGDSALIGPIPVGQHISRLGLLGIQWLPVLQPPHDDVLGVEVQSLTL